MPSNYAAPTLFDPLLKNGSGTQQASLDQIFCNGFIAPFTLRPVRATHIPVFVTNVNERADWAICLRDSCFASANAHSRPVLCQPSCRLLLGTLSAWNATHARRVMGWSVTTASMAFSMQCRASWVQISHGYGDPGRLQSLGAIIAREHANKRLVSRPIAPQSRSPLWSRPCAASSSFTLSLLSLPGDARFESAIVEQLWQPGPDVRNAG